MIDWIVQSHQAAKVFGDSSSSDMADLISPQSPDMYNHCEEYIAMVKRNGSHPVKPKECFHSYYTTTVVLCCLLGFPMLLMGFFTIWTNLEACIGKIETKAHNAKVSYKPPLLRHTCCKKNVAPILRPIAIDFDFRHTCGQDCVGGKIFKPLQDVSFYKDYATKKKEQQQESDSRSLFSKLFRQASDGLPKNESVSQV